MTQPLVSISIPTFNSEQFIEVCLDAILRQTYKHIEVNIVDGDSVDRTVAIARAKGITHIITCKDALLQARYEGVQAAKGKYTLLLDSDQVLEPEAISNAVAMAQGHKDMLVLEEDVYRSKSLAEKLFQMDRHLVHAVRDFDPYTSVMLPRFYDTELLLKAFRNIPESALKNVGGQDHAIIYFEVWQYSQRVGLVPNAVKHIEPSSLKVIWKKFYRWGQTSKAAHHPRYKELLERKERFRKGLFAKGHTIDSFGSILLLIMKGIPYYAGYFTKKYKVHF